jgi:hypothetical protein
MMGANTTMRAETPMTPTIAARLDRLPVTRRHVLVVVIVGIGMFVDLYEVFLAGTLSTVFKRAALQGGAAPSRRSPRAAACNPGSRCGACSSRGGAAVR